MRSLTPEQSEAAKPRGRATSLLAAAGSGKTTVLVERYVALIQSGTRPSEILTVTFTNEAAEQLRHRIIDHLTAISAEKDCIERVERSASISTLHGFCYRVVAEFGSLLSLPAIGSIATVFHEATLFEKQYDAWIDGLVPEQLEELLGYFSHFDLKSLTLELFHARHRQVNEKAPVPLLRLKELAAPLFSGLETELLAKGLFGFDDLEHYAERILTECPEALTRLQTRIKFCLVDEFQDTSRSQWRILTALLGGDLQKLFLVGDPKQSIYGFRHAEPRLFSQVSQQVVGSGGDGLELTANFRTAPGLLGEVNAIGSRLFETATLGYQPMRPGLTSHQEGKWDVRRFKLPEGRKQDPTTEIEATATAVREMIASGVPPSDITLLFRVIDRMSLYEAALSKHGIAVTCRKTMRLFESYDVLDVCAYLKAIANPLDDHALSAFLRTRFMGWDLAKLEKATRAEGANLLEKIQAQGHQDLTWLLSLLEQGELEVRSVLHALFANTHYFPRRSDAFLQFLAPLLEENITAIEAVERIRAWKARGILVKSERGGGERGVRLMTVHAAKGLEFPHVLLVDTMRKLPTFSPALLEGDDGEWGLRYRDNGEITESPHYAQIKNRLEQRELEEAKRILYVALTRAQQSLTLVLPDDSSRAPRGSWASLLEIQRAGGEEPKTIYPAPSPPVGLGEDTQTL